MPDPNLIDPTAADPNLISPIVETFLTERWVIRYPNRTGRGTLDRVTGIVTYPEADCVYDGPGSLTPLPQRYTGTPVDPVLADEHVLRIEPGNRDILAVGMVAECPKEEGRETAEWMITRFLEAADPYTTQAVVRRRVAVPTTGGVTT